MYSNRRARVEDGELVEQQSDARRRRGRSRSPARQAKEKALGPTVNRVRASENPPKYEEYNLSTDRDENDEVEVRRLREERRRLREQIIQKHESQNKCAQSPKDRSNSEEPPAFDLEKKGDIEGGRGVLAAEYDPNADPNADDVRHRIAVVNAADAPASTAGEQPVAAADGDDEDEFDMFADDDTLPAVPQTGIGKSASGTRASLAATAAMADSWDDPEGYYRTVIGELLDDRYLVQSILGQGVFSSVVKALDKHENTQVAIKIIRQNEAMYRAGVKEQRILERLQGADPEGRMHVVRYLRSFVHRGHMCLCFELMSLDLRQIVRKYGRNSGLSLQAVQVYGAHLLLALDLLRRCQVVHGDIKPDNCFVSDERNNVKLGDLGSACDVAECEVTAYLVSRYYRAPEIILGMAYDQAIDMWSLGVTLFELYTGHIMFPGRNNNHMLRLMMEARGPFSNRMLRKGQMWQQHFEDNGGGVMDLVVRPAANAGAASAVGTDMVQRVKIAKPTRDIKSRVLQATPPGSSNRDVELATRLAGLLERCLELNPEKRITPAEALRHPFFAQT
ncbi:U4/U6 small nuclear ribonucleoprotein prp4 [Coemansia interrupta]|uniref:non-specific serine/threonine protein kinase n=1 Tax=Coemansia interrupta TaxID=1126814 RepID=A0A9W8LJH4_9FUNG|nr:U4/U6 small nuclear ribonucleoprotein prp4 [Coemansia interrupta]